MTTTVPTVPDRGRIVLVGFVAPVLIVAVTGAALLASLALRAQGQR
jgi:hypothetical protein